MQDGVFFTDVQVCTVGNNDVGASGATELPGMQQVHYDKYKTSSVAKHDADESTNQKIGMTTQDGACATVEKSKSTN